MTNHNSERTKRSINNVLFTILGQSVGVLSSFIARIFFLHILNTEYLGINGLFTNVLSVLSLVELGVGPAISFSLYKPLAERDMPKIKSLMRFFQKAYITIGFAVLILGVAFLPFYRILINKPPQIPNLDIIYLLFVANSAISYFYSYKRSIIICDQKQYIISIFDLFYKVVLNISQIILLVITRNYILFLAIQIILTWAENFLISKIADQMYPYLRSRETPKLYRKDLKEITHNISAMMLHQIGGVVVNATDNIVISRVCGLIWVGLYSNYSLIIQSLTYFTTQIFNATIASVGNLGATESPDKVLKVFYRIFFIDFWIFGFSSISLIVLFNPFIQLWVSNRYVLAMPIVLSFVFVYYIMGMRQAVLTFTNATGVFWYSRYKPIFEALINLVASVILAHYWGMAGVFAGTIVGSLTTSFWVDPYVLYKHVFKKKFYAFFIRYLIYTIATIVVGLFVWWICEKIVTVSWFTLFIKALICLIVINGLFVVFFFRTNEFHYALNIFKQLPEKILKKRICHNRSKL